MSMLPDPSMTTHSRKHVREEEDFYPTVDAHWLIPALLLSYRVPHVIWEPQAGEGHLARELVDHDRRVICTELIERTPIKGAPRITYLRDFFAFTAPPEGTQAIVMNPPYSDATAHIHHGLRMASLVGGKVCVLMRNEASCAQTKDGRARARLFAESPFFDCKIELTRRPRWFEGAGNASPRHNYAWFCWDIQKPRDRAPTIKWAP